MPVAMHARSDSLDHGTINSSTSTYETELSEYNPLVDTWSADLPNVSGSAERYEAAIVEYNSKVDAHNAVAKKASSRW